MLKGVVTIVMLKGVMTIVMLKGYHCHAKRGGCHHCHAKRGGCHHCHAKRVTTVVMLKGLSQLSC